MKIYINIEDDMNQSEVASLFQNLGAAFGGTVGGARVTLNVGAARTASEAGAPLDASKAPPAIPLSLAVMEFMDSDPRYTVRSLSAILGHFPDVPVDVVHETLFALVADGALESVRRRRDGVLMYRKAAQGTSIFTEDEDEDEERPVRALDGSIVTDAGNLHDDIVTFLGSDDRYTSRSFEAVTKHFSTWPKDHLDEALSDLVVDGRVEVLHRVRDNAPLYRLA